MCFLNCSQQLGGENSNAAAAVGFVRTVDSSKFDLTLRIQRQLIRFYFPCTFFRGV